MAKFIRIAIATLMLLSAAFVFSQKPAPSPMGKWKGESLCTVKPNPCHDEVVVYEITAGEKGTFVWKADKIVDGEQQNMGTLDCSFAPKTQTFTCDMPGKGIWSFHVKDDAMTGTLKLSDGTLFRKVNVKRR